MLVFCAFSVSQKLASGPLRSHGFPQQAAVPGSDQPRSSASDASISYLFVSVPGFLAVNPKQEI